MHTVLLKTCLEVAGYLVKVTKRVDTVAGKVRHHNKS